MATLSESGRRERIIVCAAAVALVFVRGFVATYYEGFYFDSDQAIVGLMARHLSRFHHFPLFYYSLNYLLGVQAWIIAPVFWIVRSSVAAMRVPYVLLNAGVAVALIAMLTRQLSLRPAWAFVAALPFIIPSPGAANHLLELAGASVEPFAYVLALWALRRRPFVFGVLLAVAYFHREFTIFALPALVVAEFPRWTSDLRARAREAGTLVAGFACIWIVVGVLKAWLANGSVGLQLASLQGQMCFEWPEFTQRVEGLLTEALPSLYGFIALPVSTWRMTTPVVAGSKGVAWVMYAAAALMLVRLLWIWRRPAPTDPAPHASPGFAVYLTLVGACTAAVYPLSCQVMLHTPPLLRYLLLALLVPAGLAAAFFARERSRALRVLAGAAIVFWSGANLSDNVAVIRSAVADPPLNEHRALVDYLLAHQIRYARAIYWDAYVVDFLSRERVITASTDIVRIPEYQAEVDAHADSAVMLQRVPCSGNERVASWCIQRP